MKRVLIKVTLERVVLLSEEAWESFNKELPLDMEDLEMLQDEANTYTTELIKAELI